MGHKYILGVDGKTPIPEDDNHKWGDWMEKSHGKRHVGDDKVGGYRVSTVFLGVDHAFGVGRDELFETMVFGPGDEGFAQWRYSTWEEAERGHAKVRDRVHDLVLQGLSPDQIDLALDVVDD